MQADEILTNLTSKQRCFLACRSRAETDKAALEQAKVCRTSLAKWRKQPEFLTAYAYSLEHEISLPEPVEVVKRSPGRPPAPAGSDEKLLMEAVRTELHKHVNRLPEIFERLFAIAADGTDAVALKAIAIIGEWFDVPAASRVAAASSPVQAKVLAWTQINLGKELSQGQTVEAVEGEYEVMESQDDA